MLLNAKKLYSCGSVHVLMCVWGVSHLHKLIENHSVKAGQVLHIVPLHYGTVLPDVCPELLHVEDELCNMPEK